MTTKNSILRAIAWLMVFYVPGQALACPFCSAVSQTLRQEMRAMDAIAIASLVPGTETDSSADFKIESVLMGQGVVTQDQEVAMNFYGKPDADKRFLVMGLSPPDVIWSTPLPLSETAENYIRRVTELPAGDENALERLEFYMDFLEHEESLLARDAYDEFASASYGNIKALKPKMDRQQLIEWITDTSLPPERKRLYLVMLGVCGEVGDADLLEEIMRSEDQERRGGLDAMIACYITLKKESGMGLIDELFLANQESPYVDTYAAIMALRFHGTEGGIVERKRVLESMRLVLARPELADLVIPDLARWEDWTQVEKLADLFRNADKKSTWVRVPVINYLRACPLPEAEAVIEELKEIDPGAYKRATSLFPFPRSNDSSSFQAPWPQGLLRTQIATTDSEQILGELLASQGGPDLQVGGAPKPNSWSAAVVMLMATTTLGIMMWLTITGTGAHSRPQAG